MDIEQGYKQTEIGVIPKDWETARVGDISRVIRGASPRPKGDKRFYGGPVPRLMVEDVTRDGKTVFPRVDSLTLEGAKRSRPCKRGTLTLVCSGTVGIPSFLGIDACIHDGFLALIGVRENVSSEFLYYQFDRLRLLFETSATHGGVFTNLTTGGVREFVVPLPPTKTEQRAIAEGLSDVDALLSGLDRLIAKKCDLKQATMQQLFARQARLPGFNSKWKMSELREVCTKIQDGTHFSPKLGGNDYLYVTSKNIDFGTLNLSKVETIAAAEHAKIYKRCDVRKGDLLLTKDGVNTGNCALNTLDEPFSLLSSVAFLRFDTRYHAPAFFLYQILSEQCQRQISDLMSGNAITRLTLAKIKTLRFAVASFEEQVAIAEVLSDIDAEIAVLQERREKTRALKQAIMQELLTGNRRLI